MNNVFIPWAGWKHLDWCPDEASLTLVVVHLQLFCSTDTSSCVENPETLQWSQVLSYVLPPAPQIPPIAPNSRALWIAMFFCFFFDTANWKEQVVVLILDTYNTLTHAYEHNWVTMSPNLSHSDSFKCAALRREVGPTVSSLQIILVESPSNSFPSLLFSYTMALAYSIVCGVVSSFQHWEAHLLIS